MSAEVFQIAGGLTHQLEQVHAPHASRRPLGGIAVKANEHAGTGVPFGQTGGGNADDSVVPMLGGVDHDLFRGMIPR